MASTTPPVKPIEVKVRMTGDHARWLREIGKQEGGPTKFATAALKKVIAAYPAGSESEDDCQSQVVGTEQGRAVAPSYPPKPEGSKIRVQYSGRRWYAWVEEPRGWVEEPWGYDYTPSGFWRWGDVSPKFKAQTPEKAQAKAVQWLAAERRVRKARALQVNFGDLTSEVIVP